MQHADQRAVALERDAEHGPDAAILKRRVLQERIPPGVLDIHGLQASRDHAGETFPHAHLTPANGPVHGAGAGLDPQLAPGREDDGCGVRAHHFGHPPQQSPQQFIEVEGADRIRGDSRQRGEILVLLFQSLQQLVALILQPLFRLLGQRLLPADLRLAQLPLHGGNEPDEIPLEDVILGARLHHRHRRLFADVPRDDDEREIAPALPEQLQRGGCVELRHRIIGNHQVPGSAIQGRLHGFRRLYALENGIIVCLPKLLQEQLGVIRRVLDD